MRMAVTDEHLQLGKQTVHCSSVSITNQPRSMRAIIIQVLAAVYRAAAIHWSEGASRRPALALAAIEHNPFVIPVRKLSAEIFVSAEPCPRDDKDEHLHLRLAT